jgi:hypothetical protein
VIFDQYEAVNNPISILVAGKPLRGSSLDQIQQVIRLSAHEFKQFGSRCFGGAALRDKLVYHILKSHAAFYAFLALITPIPKTLKQG